MSENEHRHQITIALAGNPNAGKTTLFNSLTGLKQKVANYPGVTVERKEGPWAVNGHVANLIDLPGLYSLDATSLDEQIASDIIRGEQKDVPKPDAIVAVVDATNLERNLYLVMQMFEFGVPVVIALTMIDVFEKQKHEIDIEMQETAQHAGVNLKRAPALNDSPLFIRAMADVVLDHLRAGALHSPQYPLKCPGCVNDQCRVLLHPACT